MVWTKITVPKFNNNDDMRKFINDLLILRGLKFNIEFPNNKSLVYSIRYDQTSPSVVVYYDANLSSFIDYLIIICIKLGRVDIFKYTSIRKYEFVTIKDTLLHINLAYPDYKISETIINEKKFKIDAIKMNEETNERVHKISFISFKGYMYSYDIK